MAKYGKKASNKVERAMRERKQGKLKSGRSGATLGLRLTVNNLMRAIGPPAFGLIGTAFGLLSVFWINAVMMGAGGVLSRPREFRSNR